MWGSVEKDHELYKDKIRDTKLTLQMQEEYSVEDRQLIKTESQMHH